MSLRHPSAVKWEGKLKKIFDEIDDILEDRHGNDFPLHPSRPEQGKTRNKESDGLFNVGGVFSAGYGSEHGRGYVVEVHMATLSHVPQKVRDEIEREVADLLNQRLAKEFNGVDLRVDRDGGAYKIHGDLGLGKA